MDNRAECVNEKEKERQADMRRGGKCIVIIRGREIWPQRMQVEKRGIFDCEWVKVDHEASETCCCPFVEVRKTDWSPGGMRGVAE